MNTIRGKTFLFPVTACSSHGTHQDFCTRHRVSFPVEWQKAYGLDHPTPWNAKLKIVTSVTAISLSHRIPYYSMIFNIEYEDDIYYYDTILRVRDSHARQLIDLFHLAAISQ
jgi:hypothetical protein